MKFLSEILRLTLIVQDIRGQTYFADKVVEHVPQKTCAIFSRKSKHANYFCWWMKEKRNSCLHGFSVIALAEAKMRENRASTYYMYVDIFETTRTNAEQCTIEWTWILSLDSRVVSSHFFSFFYDDKTQWLEHSKMHDTCKRVCKTWFLLHRKRITL